MGLMRIIKENKLEGENLKKINRGKEDVIIVSGFDK
ncbi:MAG: hypothetical protein CM15mV45_870 [uncultured marine virus]|nr:MAG: hypothetical protein CM15mV45_870 [uncultured marine virus]